MDDTGAPPVIPIEFQQYNSYVEDPKYQIKFTIVWTAVLAAAILAALPRIIRGHPGTFGISEHLARRFAYTSIDDHDDRPTTGKRTSMCRAALPQRPVSAPRRLGRVLAAACYWTPPYIGLSAGQLVLLVAYFATVLTCVILHAPLVDNSNRAGFLALAQLPPLFLLAGKASPLALLLPPTFAYTRLNVFHRWSARGVVLCAGIHGGLWIRNHVVWSIPILGQQKETSGIAAFGVLGVLALTSVKVVRERAWSVFYWVHFLAFPAFFVTLCYHTPYASPWIFAPIAFYAFDLFMRAARIRIKDAVLLRVDNGMTIIRIPDCDAGFRAGQHVRVRVFFGGRGAFEAHPFSIMCAPSGSSCVRARDVDAYTGTSVEKGHGDVPSASAGLVLGVRVAGGWTKALNEYALQAGNTAGEGGVPVHVMFDGPYGGCGLELGAYERVLLVAGGSGATFAVGVLDTLVAAPETKTRRVELVWCVRSFGAIAWLAPLLSAIAETAHTRGDIELRITVYVTCLCVPEAVPRVRGLNVRVGGRPAVRALVAQAMGLEKEAEHGEEGGVEDQEVCGCGCVEEALEKEKEQEKEGDVEKAAGRFVGRVAVCASGPLGLTTEAANAVARLAGRGGVDVGLHTEVYAI